MLPRKPRRGKAKQQDHMAEMTAGWPLLGVFEVGKQRITLKLMDDPLGGGGYYIAAILSDRNMNIYHRFGWANLDIAIGQAIINLSGSAMQRRPTKSRKGAKHGNA